MAEIKLKRRKVNLKILREKSEKLLSSYPGYEARWLALGIEDISAYINGMVK